MSSETRSGLTRIVLAALLSTLLALAGLSGAAPVHASVGSATSELAQIFSINTRGAIDLYGNGVLACSSSVANCANGRDGNLTAGSGYLNNNIYDMRFVDIDGDSRTFNSSSSDVALDDGSKVLYAGLMWTGVTKTSSTPARYPPNVAKSGEVLVKAPGNDYQRVVADRNIPSSESYRAYADVTELVRSSGAGTYTVGNVQVASGIGSQGSWGLVVVTRNASFPIRNLNVYFGGDSLGTDTPSRTVTVPNFKTPSTGVVKSTLGVLAVEGDRGINGDGLSLANQPVRNSKNPVTNAFNSSISNLGVNNTARNPAYINNMNVDIDTFDVTGYLANDSTSADIDFFTTGDGYGVNMITLATDMESPSLHLASEVRDLNGEALRGGETLEYSTTFVNDGMDGTSQTTFRTTLPMGVTYVEDSPRIDGAEVPAAYDPSTRELRITGGAYDTGDNGTVTFQAKVDADAADQLEIVNTVSADYRGVLNGLNVKSVAEPTTIVVDSPRADLGVVTAADRPKVTTNAATPVTYTTVVTNNGPGPARGVAVQSMPQEGILLLKSTIDGVVCGTTTCQVGGLPNGETAVVKTFAVVTPPSIHDDTGDSDASVRGTAQPAGAVGEVKESGVNLTTLFQVTSESVDPNPVNDTAVAGSLTNSPPLAVDDSAETTDGVAVSIDVLANDTDPEGDPLTIAVVGSPAHGGASIVGGEVLYAPTAGYAGADSFTYEVTDGTSVATGRVGITVAPVAPSSQDKSVTTNGKSPLDVDVLAGATSTGPLHLSSTSQGSSGGKVTVLPGAGPSGRDLVRYEAGLAAAGVETFTYTAEDSWGQVTTSTVTVTITNGAPVITSNPAQAIDAASAPQPLTATDPDGDAVSFSSSTVPLGLTLHADGTWEGKADPGTYTVNFQACDDRLPQACTEGTLELTVTAVPVPDPVDPPADPVDPPVDPTDPVDPVDPPSDPVDPPTEPVDPVTPPVVTVPVTPTPIVTPPVVTTPPVSGPGPEPTPPVEEPEEPQVPAETVFEPVTDTPGWVDEITDTPVEEPSPAPVTSTPMPAPAAPTEKVPDVAAEVTPATAEEKAEPTFPPSLEPSVGDQEVTPSSLAYTGSDSGRILSGGILLGVLGLLLMLAGKRMKRRA